MQVPLGIEFERVLVILLILVNTRHRYPDAHTRLYNEGFATRKCGWQLERAHADTIEHGGLRVATHRLVEDGVEVGHRVHRLVRRLAVFRVLEDFVDLGLQLLLNVRIDRQLVGDYAHLRGGGIEAAEEEGERLRRHRRDVEFQVFAGFT